MGTGSKDGCQKGLIPQVMNALFNKIETLKDQTEFHLHVSFIEVYSFYGLPFKFVHTYTFGHVLQKSCVA